MQKELIERAKELLGQGTVNRVIGWKAGEFAYDTTPAVFYTAEELEKSFVFNRFCGANLSKYLVKESKKEGKILVFLKPCDTYSFNQLIKEHRISREAVYVVGIPCEGMLDAASIRNQGIDGILDVKVDNDGSALIYTLYGEQTLPVSDCMPDRCRNCKGKKHMVYDELIGNDGELADSHRFDEVERLENMTADERFAFWQSELSRCIRCNACRDVCPACTCENCVFNNPKSGMENKAAADSFEESMYHIIRAFHVAGRCTDCGECSRVCPQHIPLHLLNRKFMKDINEFYGTYLAGEDTDSRAPLTNYSQDDANPDIIYRKGGN